MYKFANLALVVILVLCLNTSSAPIDSKVPDKIQTIEPTEIHAGRGHAYSNMMVQLISEDGEVQQIHHEKTQSQSAKKKKGHQQTLSPSIRGAVLDSNFVQVESKKTKNHMKRQPQPVPRKSQKHSMKKCQNSGNKYL